MTQPHRATQRRRMSARRHGRSRLVAVVAGLVVVAGCAPGTERVAPRSAEAPTPRTVPSGVVTPTSTPTDDASVPTDCPEPSDAAGRRWRLHCTSDELAVWRERARSGPYRSDGDAGPHTPGDWDRIEASAAAYAARPAEAIWAGPTEDPDGCVLQGASAPPVAGPAGLRDAAFVALVAGRPGLADAVHASLLAQAREPGVDFADRSRWCSGELHDVEPSFPIAHWLTKLLFAYDYLGPTLFTPEETRELDAWFASAARWLEGDLELSRDDLYVDADSGDYDLTSDDPHCNGTHYHGGPPNCAVHRYYNNRRGAIVRFIGLVGVHQGDEGLQRTAQRYLDEFLRFTVFPEGLLGEFVRWEERLPDLGWAYATQAVAPLVVVADAFARAGDPTAYELVTADGLLGTEGGEKSLAFVIEALGGYVDGTYDRYATDDPEAVGDVSTRIDARHGSWIGLHDLAMVPANRYYRRDDVRDRYLRRDLGGYPEQPAPIGPRPPWSGEGGIFPGVLFMFGDLEDGPDPYPVRGQLGTR